MALLLADLAGQRSTLRALGSAVTSFATGPALAGELTRDAWVGALCLVVAGLATVEALARIGRLVRAVTCEMAIFAAAESNVSEGQNTE